MIVTDEEDSGVVNGKYSRVWKKDRSKIILY